MTARELQSDHVRQHLAEARARLGALLEYFDDARVTAEVCEQIHQHADAIAYEVQALDGFFAERLPPAGKLM